MDVNSGKDKKTIAEDIKKNDAVNMKTVLGSIDSGESSLIPIYGTFSYGSFFTFKDSAVTRDLKAEGPGEEPAELQEFSSYEEFHRDRREDGAIIIEDGVFRIRPGLGTLSVAEDDSFKLLVDSVLR